MALEISPYQIKFKYIKGIKNTLADTISRLVQIDPEVSLEPEGYEFGYFIFDEVKSIKVQAIEINSIKMESEKQPFESERNITLPITNEKLQELQREDPFCAYIIRKLELTSQNPYYREGKVLQQYIENNKQHEVTVLLQSLAPVASQLAFDGMGHNGIPHTYALLQ